MGSGYPFDFVRVERRKIAGARFVHLAIDEHHPVGRPGAWGYPDDAPRLAHTVAVEAVGPDDAHPVPFAQLLAHVWGASEDGRAGAWRLPSKTPQPVRPSPDPTA